MSSDTPVRGTLGSTIVRLWRCANDFVARRMIAKDK